MYYTDIFGRDRLIYPLKKEHVLILVAPDANNAFGLFSLADEDFPVTQGFVYGFPPDRSYINSHYPELQHGSHVIFRRYAAKLVEHDHFYNTRTEMNMVEKIYKVHVDDIETIVDDAEPTLQEVPA